MTDAARASLPPAIALLAFAAAARAVPWVEIEDQRAQRIARQYAVPLSTWCLITVAVHVIAVSAAGDAVLLSLALPLGIAVAAVWLCPGVEAGPPSAIESEEPPTASSPPAATAAPTPAGRLWAEPADEGSSLR